MQHHSKSKEMRVQPQRVEVLRFHLQRQGDDRGPSEGDINHQTRETNKQIRDEKLPGHDELLVAIHKLF